MQDVEREPRRRLRGRVDLHGDRDEAEEDGRGAGRAGSHPGTVQDGTRAGECRTSNHRAMGGGPPLKMDALPDGTTNTSKSFGSSGMNSPCSPGGMKRGAARWEKGARFGLQDLAPCFIATARI